MPNACGLGMPGLCEHVKVRKEVRGNMMRKRTDVRTCHQPTAGDKKKRKRTEARVGHQPTAGDKA